MKNLTYLLIIAFIVATLPMQAQVGVGTETPDSAAALDVSSTTQGFLPPRMTQFERNAIANPPAGLIVYCTNCGINGELQLFNGTNWTNVIGGAAALGELFQLGADIDGEAAGDQSGHSVSLSADGSRVAIGARWNDGGGTRSGHVRVYDWDGANWIQTGADIDGEAAEDRSGWSVALSADGSRVAIGAYHNSGTALQAGHVRIYDWDGANWIQTGADIDGEAAGDHSGYSVSLSADGSRVAIGGRHNQGTGLQAGHVRVYDWDGVNWIQTGADIDGEAAGDQSGWSVALSADGNRLAIGAPENDSTGTDAGHVRIYDWDGANWVQAGADIDGEAAGDLSGTSVSLSADGSRVAIGAPRNAGNGGYYNGHVRIYDWNGANWVQADADIDGVVQNESGTSVSLSADGSTVAIGSPSASVLTGLVRVYYWDGASWVQLVLDINGEATFDYSGWSVSLSADASRVAIGAFGNDGNGGDSGHVRVYE